MNRTTRSARLGGPRPGLGLPQASLRARATPLRLLLAFLISLLAADCAHAAATLTLDQLRRDPCLTPDRFMSFFRDFQFHLGAKRQPPETFLASRTGDCDDFACLAAEILREKKYTTRLIAVFMKDQTHVVCYVEEIHGYLDYNRRADAPAIQAASNKIEDIADKVAAYFRAPWRSASEFTYKADHPQFGQIVFR